MWITLKLTAHAGGNCERPAEDLAPAIKACINAIFWHNKDYTLHIWFLKPWASRSDLDIRCLLVMRYLLNQRIEPLSLAREYRQHTLCQLDERRQKGRRAWASLGSLGYQLQS